MGSRTSPTQDVRTFVTKLIDEYQNPLFHYLGALLEDRMLAREQLIELFQEALASVQRGDAPFTATGKRKQIRRELFRMATRKIEAEWQRQRAVRVNAPAVPVRVIENELDMLPPFDTLLAEPKVIARTVAGLPDRARIYLLLHVVYGFTPAEIANDIVSDADMAYDAHIASAQHGERGERRRNTRNSSSSVRMWLLRAKEALHAERMWLSPSEVPPADSRSRKGQKQ